MFEILIAPIITGTAAGLAVAFGVAVARWLAKPRFELKIVGDRGYGVLINQTLRPILLGDSFCLETQKRLLDPADEARDKEEASLSRLIIGREGSRIVLLNGAKPGYYVTFTYRPVWGPSRRKDYSELGSEADSVGPFLWKSRKGTGERNQAYKKWKEKSVLVDM